MEVMVTAGAVGHAKLHSNHHHRQTNTQFLYAGCPSFHPTNSIDAPEGKNISPWTYSFQSYLGSSVLVLTNRVLITMGAGC